MKKKKNVENAVIYIPFDRRRGHTAELEHKRTCTQEQMRKTETASINKKANIIIAEWFVAAGWCTHATR